MDLKSLKREQGDADKIQENIKRTLMNLVFGDTFPQGFCWCPKMELRSIEAEQSHPDIGSKEQSPNDNTQVPVVTRTHRSKAQPKILLISQWVRLLQGFYDP